MRTMTDIQAAEIHSYGQGKAFFHPARDSLHETPRCLAHNWEDECRGWERHSYHTPATPVIGRNSSFALAELRLQKSVTLAEKSKYHLVKFLGNLTWVAMPPEHARRSNRIAREIAILLVGSDMEGKVFSEQTKTVLLSRHGAGIVSQYVLSAEQELILRRLDTDKEVEVHVVGQLGHHGESHTYGVAFLDAEVDLWGVDFPSMTDSEKEASRVLLQCSSCKAREMLEQSDLESDVYLVNEGIVRSCKTCGSSTIWKRAAEDAGGEPARLETTPPEAEERAEPVETLPASSPDPAPTENRRKHVRTRVNFKAYIRSYAFGDDIVTCEDISRGGLRFKSRKEYVAKTEIEVAAPYAPGTPDIFVRGRIVYVVELKQERRFRCGVCYAKS
jgi:hypothetical protein